MIAELRGAEFSPCRTWRYRLWRIWDHDRPPLVVIGLNPSTADETRDDPTVRRCIGYARRWGYGGLRMLNIFAFRATDPKTLLAASDPVGPDNPRLVEQEVAEVLRRGGAVLAAWGRHGRFQGRGDEVRRFLELARPTDAPLDDTGTACLGWTRSEDPLHPLYQPADARPVPFTGDGGRLVRGLAPPP